MVIERGELWWADLGEPRGSAPALRRPVLVVQADDFNRSRIQTVVVATLTSNLALASAPGNVTCRPRGTGLTRASVVNVSQLATVDRRCLLERMGKLSRTTMEEVDEGLLLVLGLAGMS
jgi:mRNA interferase MazF